MAADDPRTTESHHEGLTTLTGPPQPDAEAHDECKHYYNYQPMITAPEADADQEEEGRPANTSAAAATWRMTRSSQRADTSGNRPRPSCSSDMAADGPRTGADGPVYMAADSTLMISRARVHEMFQIVTEEEAISESFIQQRDAEISFLEGHAPTSSTTRPAEGTRPRGSESCREASTPVVRTEQGEDNRPHEGEPLNTAQPSPRQAEDSCAICLGRIHGYDTLRELPCQHKFHEHCISAWLRRRSTCPLCIQRASTTDLVNDEPSDDGESGDSNPEPMEPYQPGFLHRFNLVDLDIDAEDPMRELRPSWGRSQRNKMILASAMVDIALKEHAHLYYETRVESFQELINDIVRARRQAWNDSPDESLLALSLRILHEIAQFRREQYGDEVYECLKAILLFPSHFRELDTLVNRLLRSSASYYDGTEAQSQWYAQAIAYLKRWASKPLCHAGSQEGTPHTFF